MNSNPPPRSVGHCLRAVVIVHKGKDTSERHQFAKQLAVSLDEADGSDKKDFQILEGNQEKDVLAAIECHKNVPLFVISRELINLHEGPIPKPSLLAERLREVASSKQRHLALLAIGAHKTTIVSEIDCCLPETASPIEVATEICGKLAHRLWLKMPPPTISPQEEFAFRLQAATKTWELHQAFKLRYQVYNALGYLSDATSENARLDIDSYDRLAFQVVVLDHCKNKIIGTFRIIVSDHFSPYHTSNFSDRPQQVLSLQQAWIREIIKKYGNLKLKVRLRQSPRLPLPIFQSMSFSQNWLKEFEPIMGKCCEISRVVVDPGYRGLHIFDLMMRGALAFASEFNRPVILLECASHHIGMYQKYGFTLLGLHGRVQQLDQKAAGMRLNLDESKNNDRLQMAKRQISMLASQPPWDIQKDHKMRHTCMCNQFPNCWQQGAYGFRKHPNCPLVDWH